MASKSKRRRRVLGASCILAALIIVGSSFAWFTSKDEVTNRLTASSNYGVTIAEDFTPPENWVPGQTIDKNVGVVNTGNVDAFVRAWLEGEMRVIAQNASNTSHTAMTESLTPVDDNNLKKANLNYSIGTGVYLKELDKTKLVENPDNQSTTSPDEYTELMAVQAGGELAYAPVPTSGASYKFTPNEAISVTNSAGAIQHLAKGVEYTVTIDGNATDNIAVTTSGTAGTITLKSLDAFRTIDSNSFVPVADGLYIFKRNTSLGTPTTDDFQYSGYYVKTIGADKHYFALEYDNTGSQRSDYVLSDTAITTDIHSDTTYDVNVSNVKMFTASQDKVDNTGLTWTSLKGVTKDGVIYTTNDNGMTWKKGTVALDSTNDATLIAALNNLTKFDMFQVKRTTGNGDNVLIDIALANLGSGAGNAEKWTAITDANKTTTFQYNNDLEDGATTDKLVDSMTMATTVTTNDYIAFDFDLNVKMESIQVTVAENGDEGFATVSPWSVASTATYSDATGAAGTVTNGEIELIAWS